MTYPWRYIVTTIDPRSQLISRRFTRPRGNKPYFRGRHSFSFWSLSCFYNAGNDNSLDKEKCGWVSSHEAFQVGTARQI